MFFHKKNLYSDIPDVLHLGLGPVLLPEDPTSNHSGVNRGSLLPNTLSNEVQVAWNAPSEFSHFKTSLIKESLDKYFKEGQTGLRFYERKRLALMSSTIAEFMKKRSRILFD